MAKNLPAIYVKPETVIQPAMIARIKKTNRTEIGRRKLGPAVGLVLTGLIIVVALLTIGAATRDEPFFIYIDNYIEELRDQYFEQTTLLIVMVSGVALYFAEDVKNFFEKKSAEPRREIDFECPACLYRFDINQDWTCGNCKDEGHGKHKNQTPIDGCAARYCSDREQSAVQCPQCSRHLIIDPRGYAVRGTSEPPYPGAARMKNDNKTPITGSSSRSDGVDLQSYFKGL